MNKELFEEIQSRNAARKDVAAVTDMHRAIIAKAAADVEMLLLEIERLQLDAELGSKLRQLPPGGWYAREALHSYMAKASQFQPGDRLQRWSNPTAALEGALSKEPPASAEPVFALQVLTPAQIEQVLNSSCLVRNHAAHNWAEWLLADIGVVRSKGWPLALASALAEVCPAVVASWWIDPATGQRLPQTYNDNVLEKAWRDVLTHVLQLERRRLANP